LRASHLTWEQRQNFSEKAKSIREQLKKAIEKALSKARMKTRMKALNKKELSTQK